MNKYRYGLIDSTGTFNPSSVTRMNMMVAFKFANDFSKVKAYDNAFNELYTNAIKAGNYVIALDANNDTLYGWIPGQKEETLEIRKFA